MADIFDIDLQKSQALRFVNLNRYDLPQNYDDRLLPDLVYPRTTNMPYVQLFEQSDYLRIHFRTDYSGYSIFLIEEPTKIEQDITGNQENVFEDPQGRKYFNLNVPLASLSGCYFIEIRLYQADSPINTFRSDRFKVFKNVPNSVWVECYGNELSYNDSQHWKDNLRQGFRIEARKRTFEFSQSKNVYDSVNYVPETLKSKPNRAIRLEVNKEAQYLLEKINVFLNHDEFYVDGIRYNNDEPVSHEPIGDSLYYKGTITLIESDYQNGESRRLTGDTPPSPPPETADKLLINSTDNLLINNTEVLIIT